MNKLTASLTLMALLFAGTAMAAENPAPTAPQTRESQAKMPHEKGRDMERKKAERKRARIEECDKDKDGALSLDEYLACFPKGNKETFSAIDGNNDGKITRDEYKAWREAHRQKIEEKRKERRQELFKKCDTDGNGVLSLEEFMQCQPKPRDGKNKKPFNGKGPKPVMQDKSSAPASAS